MSKLTRARVPMCPECGEEMVQLTRWPATEAPRYGCDTCLEGSAAHNPDWGYYKPDVEGVVRQLRGLRGFIEEETGETMYTKEIGVLADELEGKP